MKTEKNSPIFEILVVILVFAFAFWIGSVAFPEVIHIFVESIK